MNCVAFHPINGQILASCSDDGKIKIWKVELATESLDEAADSGLNTKMEDASQ